MRGLVILLGLVLVATACRTEVEGSDGTITQIDATVQIRYADDPGRADSLDLDDAAVSGPIHVFLAYLGSDVERVIWTIDGEELNADAQPPFDLVGGDGSRALPFDTSELLGGNHSVTARVEMGGGVSLEVDAQFSVLDGTTAEDRDAPEGWADVLSVNQRSLEDGADGWRDQGNSVITTTADDAKDGTQALLATVSDQGVWTDDAETSRVGTSPIPVDAATTAFEGRAFVKVEAGSQARCEVRFYAGSKILDTAPGPSPRRSPARGHRSPARPKRRAARHTSGSESSSTKRPGARSSWSTAPTSGPTPTPRRRRRPNRRPSPLPRPRPLLRPLPSPSPSPNPNPSPNPSRRRRRRRDARREGSPTSSTRGPAATWPRAAR